MTAWLDALHAQYPHFNLVVSLVWGGYVLVLAAWIALQKREPIATLSWLLSLALLPVLGLAIYHFLGPTRIKRQQLKRLRAKARLQASWPCDNIGTPPSTLMRLAQGCSGYAPSSCDSVTFYGGGGATFDALALAIAGARRHVHLEYYIFEPDHTGTRIRDALVERAKAGIKVRLLLDALGSANASEKFLQPLRDAGGEVAFFHRFRLRRLWRPKMNLRSHRKIVIIDGAIGFTGGINITDEEDERLHADAYHDLHLRVDGDVVAWLQLAFIEDWTYAGASLPGDDGLWPEIANGNIRAQVLPSGPDSPWECIHRVKLAAIHQAQTRVWLATPYFVPGEAARMALTSAGLRGLDVRLLVPKRSDSRLVTAAAHSYFDELAAAGVKVFEYPTMMHTKALLVDADTCILGSANFDNRSFRLNFELSLLVEDAGVGERLGDILAADFAKARKVSGSPASGLPQRLLEATARLLSPLL